MPVRPHPAIPLLAPLLALVVGAWAPGPVDPGVHTATMPLEILRDEGQPARMGDVSLFAGSRERGSPFSFSLYFEPRGDQLGDPVSAGWTVNFGDYCRDRPSWVQSVLIGPSGQVWRGFRVAVPAGPDRGQDWSSGSTRAQGPGAQPTPGLLEALTLGGQFVLALEDDEGRRWHEATIDTLAPARRRQMFDANLKAFQAAAPDAPVTGNGLLMVRTLEVQVPVTPRPCP